ATLPRCSSGCKRCGRGRGLRPEAGARPRSSEQGVSLTRSIGRRPLRAPGRVSRGRRRRDRMTVEETIEKLIQLKLPHMASALRAELDRAVGSALTLEECIGLMVDREWTERENRRTGRRIKDAKLGMQACLEDLWCDPARGLDKAVMRTFGS